MILARHSKTNRSTIAVCLALSILGSLCAGCRHGDGGPERVVVSGSVAYQGSPIAQGTIRFTPAKGSTGPVTIAKITDGRYSADAKGGVPVGTQRIEICAYRPDPRCVGKPAPGPAREWPPREQYLPVKYNAHTDLEMAIELGHGAISKDFDLVP